MSVSLICACKNRIDALRISLNSWIKFEEITEIIICDWNSDDPIDSLLDIDSRIKIIRVNDQEYFNQPQPLNIAADLATGEYILKVDCDYIINPYYNFFDSYHPGDNSFVCGEYANCVDEGEYGQYFNYASLDPWQFKNYEKSYSPFYKYLIGLLYIKRENFLKINGYNESLCIYYAFEDDEIFKRLENAGLEKIKIDFDNTLIHIPHPDAKRFENFQGHLENKNIRDTIYSNLEGTYFGEELDWQVDYVLATQHIQENKRERGEIVETFIPRICSWSLSEEKERYYTAKVKDMDNESKLKGFPSVNYISLEESKIRQQNLKSQFNEYGIHDLNPLISKRFDECDDIVSGPCVDILDSGTKGCVVSHIKMIKKWIDQNNGEKYGFFCEDDLSLESVNYWNFTWEDFIENLPEDAECVQLYCIRDYQRPVKFEERSTSDWSVTAYILTREYAQKIVDQYYVSENQYNLTVFDTGWYPMPENVIFYGHGKVYAVNLFLEDTQLQTTFGAVNSGVKENHIESYNYNFNWWRENGNNSLDLILSRNKKPLSIVQIGANKCNDLLFEYISNNYDNIDLGVFVEPNPEHLVDIKNCYKNYNNIYIENVAIKSPNQQGEVLTLYYHTEDPNYEIATLNKEHIEKCANWEGGSPLKDCGEIKEIQVQCSTLENLFNAYLINELDWLYIDIEGMEAEVLLTFDWSKYKIKRIEFEYLHLGDNYYPILQLMESLGYKPVDPLSQNDWAFELQESETKMKTNKIKENRIETDDRYEKVVLDIEELLTEYSQDTENAELNFKIGLWYEYHGQDAAALSFFLRGAERADDDNLAYECLIHGAYSYDRQGTRDMTSKGIFQQALCLLPKRPEAYYHLSNFCRKRSLWQECYIYSSTALNFAEFEDNVILRTDVHYPGKYAIMYEKALAAWDWGKIKESYDLLEDIKQNYDISEDFSKQIDEFMEKFKKDEWFFTDEYKNILKSLPCNMDSDKNVSESENDIGKIDVVLAGHYDDATDEIISSYLKLDFVNNIIISTWESQGMDGYDSDRVKFIRVPKPETPGTDNRNLQIATAHAGLKLVTTKYCAKMRTDQLYDHDSMENMYSYMLNNREFDDQIFVAGIYPNLLFHPRDHIFWGRTCDVQQLYDIPLEYNGLADKIKVTKENLYKYYPFFVRNETYIGARYCSKFDETINVMILEPEKYLHDNCGGWTQAHQISQNVTYRAFKAFPRTGIDLKWSRKGLDNYPYDDQKIGYGECWAEDFAQV